MTTHSFVFKMRKLTMTRILSRYVFTLLVFAQLDALIIAKNKKKTT